MLIDFFFLFQTRFGMNPGTKKSDKIKKNNKINLLIYMRNLAKTAKTLPSAVLKKEEQKRR